MEIKTKQMITAIKLCTIEILWMQTQHGQFNKE